MLANRRLVRNRRGIGVIGLAITSSPVAPSQSSFVMLETPPHIGATNLTLNNYII